MADASPLQISWQDSNWIPNLTPDNVLDYFAQRSNPFYDRTCNNEVIKMQRLEASRLKSLTGIEYDLIHVQDPILYIIRKQHRHSPSEVTPIAEYYILAGVVYQAPDLSSVLNSRLLSALYHIQSAYNEAMSYSRFEAGKDYYWEFERKAKSKATSSSRQESSSTLFQRKKVDAVLTEFSKKFPQKHIKPSFWGSQQSNGVNNSDGTTQADDQNAKNQNGNNFAENGDNKKSDTDLTENIDVQMVPAKKRKL